MTTETNIENLDEAIGRSKAFTEVCDCYFTGSLPDLLVALDGLYDGEIDSAAENDGTIDVWGWTDDQSPGTMDWRLSVTLR